MTSYVALLRGINVGGKNVIRMADLRACFEELDLVDVQTYIQSGNVVFRPTKKTPPAKLALNIEKALSDAFAYDSRIALVSAEELATVVQQAPPGFGKQPEKYRYDVLFPCPPLRPKAVLPEVPVNPTVDTISAGDRALYFRRLIAKATQSKLSRLTQRPVYQELTIRNWNTTTRLLEMATA